MKLPTPQKTKTGLYRIQLRLGGSSEYIYGVSAKDCRDKAALAKAEWINGIHGVTRLDGITLRQACERYIAKKETSGKSPETIRGYDIILRNRFQSAMDTPVKNIKNWQDLYNRDAETYSPKTMKNTWAFIRSAVKDIGIIPPTIEEVQQKRREHAFLSPDEIKRFVAAAQDDKYAIALYLALCSCRASEILALDWQDVDLKKNTVYIHRAMVRDKGNKKVDKPVTKTDSSTRYIPIFIPELNTALSAVKNKTGKVVRANENTLLEHSNAVCDKAGLPRIGIHGLRHSAASLMYSLNVPEKIAMQIGGWNDYNTMRNIYTHIAQKDLEKHSTVIADFYNRKNA